MDYEDSDLPVYHTDYYDISLFSSTMNGMDYNFEEDTIGSGETVVMTRETLW